MSLPIEEGRWGDAKDRENYEITWKPLRLRMYVTDGREVLFPMLGQGGRKLSRRYVATEQTLQKVRAAVQLAGGWNCLRTGEKGFCPEG